MFWNYYVLKVLLLETITFSDATLSDIKVVLCYVLSQYRYVYSVWQGKGCIGNDMEYHKTFTLCF